MASQWFISAALSKVWLHCLPVDQPQPWPQMGCGFEPPNVHLIATFQNRIFANFPINTAALCFVMSSYPTLIYMHHSQPITLMWQTYLNMPPPALLPSAYPWTRAMCPGRLHSKLDLSSTSSGRQSNTSPALLEYLNNVVKMLTEWQVGLLDDDSLFQKFWSSEFNLAGDLMARYWMVSSFSYSWWKDCFDTMLFEMPDRLSLEEVRELYQAHMEQMISTPARHEQVQGGSDPLLANLRALRDDLKEFGDHLQTWLLKKTDKGRIALEAMALLEGPKDAGG
ncbi:hypothetical protein BDR05DRAFT_1000132 [Suillus weaverae]|nr:hypothetical protein BDR05DRAFT_1000132 [Suillus weaverae]